MPHVNCVLWLQPVFFFMGSESSGGKEAELSKTIADLRKDLQEAQDKAAQEAGHVAQFQSLAEAAEESTKAVQVWNRLPNIAVALADGFFMALGCFWNVLQDIL